MRDRHRARSALTKRQWLTGIMGAPAAGGMLAACAPFGQAGGDTTPPASKPTGTITFWHNWAARADMLQQLVLDPFMREYPDLVVEPTTFAAAGGREKITAAVLAGTPPDCLHLQRDQYPQLLPSKAVVPLDKYLARDKLDPKIFIEADVKARTVNGQIYALPSLSGTGGLSLYWNKEHFRQAGLDPNKPPQTWSELETYAARLTVGQGEAIQRLGIDHVLSRGTVAGDYGRFAAWLYANDGNLVSADGRKVAFDLKEGSDTLNWMIQVGRRQGGADSLLQITGRAAFFQGKMAMFPEQDLLPSLARIDANAKDMDWMVAPLPINDRNPKAKLRIPTTGGHGYSVMTAAKNPEGAWQLTNWLTASDAQCNFMTREQGRIAPLKRCSTDPEAQKRPEFQVFSKIQGNVVALPFFPDITWQQRIQQHFQDAVLGKVSPDAALRTAAQEAQNALDESWRQWQV
ncbi:MAG: ABC transporter substrate-binding protein [Chloroflexi bacterium]|nr:ABC transporter substrate-binding protein [Chloroflexota bacterium]